MKYTLHQLEVFCKVAEKQSVTRASEELFMTQPAVSIQLKNFQNQFKIPLTEIIGRRIFLTEFGKVIAEKAKKVIEEIESIDHMSSMFEGILAGELKISSASTGKYVIPYYLSEFSIVYPEVNIQLDVTNKTAVINSLLNNEIDFAFISVIPEGIEIDRLDLMKNELYLVGPKGRKKLKSKSPKNLEHLRLLYREQGSATRQAMEGFIEKNEVEVNSTIELTSNEAIKQSILAGLGYSIMPLIGIRNEIQNEELSIIPIKGLPMKTTWNLVWLKQKKLTPVMQAFLKFIEDHREYIYENRFSWVEKIS